MKESSENEIQANVAESFSSRADESQKRVEHAKNKTEVEIVTVEGKIKAVRVPVIVYATRSNLAGKGLTQDGPSTSTRAKTQKDPTSSIISDLPAKSGIRSRKHEKPSKSSKKSLPIKKGHISSDLQKDFETEDLQLLKERDSTIAEELSSSEGNPGRKFEQQRRKPSHSQIINKINKTLNKRKQKGSESFSTSSKSERSISNESALRSQAKCNVSLPTDSNFKESASAHNFSSEPSTSTGASNSLEVSATEVNTRKANKKQIIICEQCNKNFTDRSNFKRHVRTHTGEKPFSCRLCIKKFRQSSSLKSHYKRYHPGEQPYQCDKCSYSCINKRDFDVHYRKHTGEKPFKCPICKRAYAQNHALKRHEKMHIRKY